MTTKWSFLEEIKWANKVFFLTAKGAFPPFPKLLSQAHKRKVRKPLLISPRDQLTTLNLKFSFLKVSQKFASKASYVYKTLTQLKGEILNSVPIKRGKF